MAEIKFAGQEAVTQIAGYVNKKLTVVSEMPLSPKQNTLVLYIGSQKPYIQGGIYEYVGNKWIERNFKETIELTQAEYDALPESKNSDNRNYFIKDANIIDSSIKVVEQTLVIS